MSPAPNLRGARLDIAIALQGRRRTLYETAKATGRRSGDIQRALRQMHQEGLLGADAAVPTRGTLYWLAAQGEALLDDELRQGQQDGRLEQQQTLVRVKSSERSRLYAVLARNDLVAIVAWAAQCGGDGDWLLALSRNASPAQTERLVAALQKAGVECDEQYVRSVLSARDLRLLVVAVDDEVGTSS